MYLRWVTKLKCMHRWTGIDEGYTVVNDMCLVQNKVMIDDEDISYPAPIHSNYLQFIWIILYSTVFPLVSRSILVPINYLIHYLHCHSLLYLVIYSTTNTHRSHMPARLPCFTFVANYRQYFLTCLLLYI